MDSTCLLATLDSDHADERVQVVLNRTSDGASTVSLVQQSWSESLGWYTQQALDLTSEQVGQLRSALGSRATGGVTSQVSRDRLAIGPDHLVCVPFLSPTRRAHSA